MLCDCQARLLDDVYLDDIPRIIHPDTAYRELGDTATPGRDVREWDLPGGYALLVNRYHGQHFQQPHMAYRDALDNVRSGKIVILRRNHAAYSGVTTSAGNLLSNLPLPLRSRLQYVTTRQLTRYRHVRAGYPAQHAQAGKTINSKAAGRLLAAGGIYNGNVEGFRNTAQQLGGDAPAGYDQVMDNKGLIIAGASVAAGLGLGRLGPVNELSGLQNLHVLGKVEGEYSVLNPGPLSNDLAETFSSGAYKEITLSTDTTFYRGGVEGKPLGQFFGYEQPQGVFQTQVDKALLPEWPDGGVSPLNTYHEIQIPAGTKVYVGEVGYQTDIYSGGTEQVVVPTPWKIPGVNILGNGVLK